MNCLSDSTTEMGLKRKNKYKTKNIPTNNAETVFENSKGCGFPMSNELKKTLTGVGLFV